MTDKRTTAREFHNAGGVDDWRVLSWGAYAYYRIGSFAQGATFVAAIADAADPGPTSRTTTKIDVRGAYFRCRPEAAIRHR